MKKVLLLLLQTLLTASMFAQNYTETESYAVDEYIEKCTDIPVVRQINTPVRDKIRVQTAQVVLIFRHAQEGHPACSRRSNMQ